jgi:hypothetical protein
MASYGGSCPDCGDILGCHSVWSSRWYQCFGGTYHLHLLIEVSMLRMQIGFVLILQGRRSLTSIGALGRVHFPYFEK